MPRRFLLLVSLLLIAGIAVVASPARAQQDLFGPVLEILYPTSGEYIGTGELEIELAFSDAGSGINLSSFSAHIVEGSCCYPPSQADPGNVTDITAKLSVTAHGEQRRWPRRSRRPAALWGHDGRALCEKPQAKRLNTDEVCGSMGPVVYSLREERRAARARGLS